MRMQGGHAVPPQGRRVGLLVAGRGPAAPAPSCTMERSSTVAHAGVICDRCGGDPLQGVRYRCSMCPDYDLCEGCIDESDSVHDRSHLFLRIDKPSAATSAYTTVCNRSPCVHKGIACSVCSVADICGFRYQCVQCPAINLCEACEAKGGHDTSHNRLKIVATAPAASVPPKLGGALAKGAKPPAPVPRASAELERKQKLALRMMDSIMDEPRMDERRAARRRRVAKVRVTNGHPCSSDIFYVSCHNIMSIVCAM